PHPPSALRRGKRRHHGIDHRGGGMSDAAVPGGIEGHTLHDAPSPLTPDAIEVILADFRTWLSDLATARVPGWQPLMEDHRLEAGRPGLLSRLFGSRPTTAAPQPAVEKLQQMIVAAADGYALSLRRVERVLPTLGLEPLAVLGEVFDPETMEAMEVVGGSGQPS